MRRLLTIAISFLMLLCVITIVFWVRSYWVSDLITFDHWTVSELRVHRSLFSCLSGRGGFRLESFWRSASLQPTDDKEWVAKQPKFVLEHPYCEYPRGAGPEIIPSRNLGFTTWTSPIVRLSTTDDSQGGERGVVMPAWFLAAVFAALPLRLFIVRWRKWRRRGTGCCERCGYDLTGNISGRCPECGKPVEATIT